jgi:acyl carrier protein
MNEEAVNSIVLTKQEIQSMLMDYLCRQFLVEPGDIQIDKSLIDTGIIDSMGLIEISSFISQNFNFRVSEEQMNRQNFGSVILIVDFIDRNKKCC